MKIPGTKTLSKLLRRKKTVFVLVVVLLWFFIHRQYLLMDSRFFQPSLVGFKGLALYEIGDYSGAAMSYRAHLQQAYQSERTALDPAWDALLRGDFETSKRESEATLRKNPEAIAPSLNLGEIALDEDAPDEALVHFDRVLKNSPDQPDALLLSSVANARSGEYEKAIAAIDRALRFYQIESRITSFLFVLKTAGDLSRLPSARAPYCLLAHYYRYLRIFDPSNASLAINFAKKAITRGDHPAYAYLTLGVVYEKGDEKEKALSAFLNSIREDPLNPEAYRRAAVIYSSMGDLVNEFRMKSAASQNGGKDSVYADDLSYFLSEKLGDYPQALRVSLGVLEERPADVVTLHRIGYLYLFIGDYADSLEYYQKAIQLNPADPVLYDGVGAALAGLGRIEEAKSAFKVSLSKDPARSGPHSQLAHLYRDERKFKEALLEYEQAFQLGESDLDEYTNLCTLYYVTSDFENAASCLKAVLRVDPRNKQAAQLFFYALQNVADKGKYE